MDFRQIAFLVGFGTFEVSDRADRTCRNPQTGEEIQIAVSKVPTFKPGKELKEAVKIKFSVQSQQPLVISSISLNVIL
ncbi:HU family DNA-binding protein [Peribacillus simplex]|uniref:HU family DNA-binding protein n=1 Tax=Peribacillus simplex TaxID=1478 RepID=A0A8B5Y3G9_9BACI|nr:HU family DNA-binding protein [Peribacillus simplex]